MSTKSYTIILYRLRDHNVQNQTKSFFSTAPKRDSSVSEAKKTIFGHRYGGLPKKLFSANEYAEIHIQRPFFTIKIAYENFWIENPVGGNMC
jgi:hypothetical protein